MGAAESLIAHIDQVIEYFNRRKLDLPDGFFDRKVQFIINGATFESLLSATPNDPLVLMLARGPAGYRFTAKALQHAVPDAKIDASTRPAPASPDPASLSAGRLISFQLRLSGTLRGSGEKINVLANIVLQLTSSGQVSIVDATIDPGELARIREARLRS